jgi:hypothetical protein
MSAAPPPSARRIVVSATLTTEPSMNARLDARIDAARTKLAFGVAAPALASSPRGEGSSEQA